MKLENIPVDVPLSFTFNPSDKYQYFGKDGRMCLVTKRLMKVFNQMKYWSKFWVIPEYSFNGQSSKMGSGPRLHYHGVIWITDLDYFLELGYTYLKDVGMFEIDTIEDQSVWEEYCLKGSTLMKPMFGRRKLPYKIDSGGVTVKSSKKQSINDFFGYQSEDSPTELDRVM